jgi:hypothetical protein
MKVKITVEYDVEPEGGKELSPKEHSNMVGMLQRITRNRVLGYRGQQMGNEHVSTGWEVTITDVTVLPVTKT